MHTSSRASQRQVWTDRLKRFADCDLTVAKFCLREKVTIASFYYWKNRVSKPSNCRHRKTTTTHFAAVNVVPSQPARSQSKARVTLADGIVIHLGTDATLATAIVATVLEHSRSKHLRDQPKDSASC